MCAGRARRRHVGAVNPYQLYVKDFMASRLQTLLGSLCAN